MPVPSVGDRHTRTLPASAPASRGTSNEGLAHSRGSPLRSRPTPWITCARARRRSSLPGRFLVCRFDLWSEAQVVGEDAKQASDHGDIPNPLQWLLPKTDRPGNVRIFRQTAVEFGVAGIVKDVDDVSPFHSGWIIDSGVFEAGIFPKLLCTRFGERFHIRLRAKMQAAGRTSLNAGGLQTLCNPVHAKRALEDLARRGTEFRDVKRAASYAIAAADTMILLKIHDAIDVLHDGAICGTGDQASRLLTVHALIFTHQKLQSAVFALVLVELDQVPVVPLRFRHRLVRIVEDGLAEGEAIPLQAGDLAGLAADTGGGIDQLADVKFAPDAGTGHGA